MFSPQQRAASPEAVRRNARHDAQRAAQSMIMQYGEFISSSSIDQFIAKKLHGNMDKRYRQEFKRIATTLLERKME